MDSGDDVVQWLKKLPAAEPLEEEIILDKRMIKKTRDIEYFEYLIKWKNHPIEDSTWMTVAKIKKIDSFIDELMNRSS